MSGLRSASTQEGGMSGAEGLTETPVLSTLQKRGDPENNSAGVSALLAPGWGVAPVAILGLHNKTPPTV